MTVINLLIHAVFGFLVGLLLPFGCFYLVNKKGFYSFISSMISKK